MSDAEVRPAITPSRRQSISSSVSRLHAPSPRSVIAATLSGSRCAAADAQMPETPARRLEEPLI